MTSIVPTNPSKVRRFGVAFVLYVGSARHWVECQKAPEDVGGDPVLVDAEIVDRLAPGTNHWVHEEPSTDDFFHYRFRHVLENETPSAWTAWIRAKAEEIPDVLPLHLAGDKPRFDLDLLLNQATGVVTAIVDAESEVKSVKLALSTTDFPTGGTGTAYDTDAEGDLTQELSPAIEDDEVAYVTASFYDAVTGGGVLLGTLRASIGEVTGPPLVAPPNFEAHFEGHKVVMTWDPVLERSIAGYWLREGATTGDPTIGITDSTRFEFDAARGIGAIVPKRSYGPEIRAFRGSAKSPQLGPVASDFINDPMPNPAALVVNITSGQGIVRLVLESVANAFASEFIVYASTTSGFTPGPTNQMKRSPFTSVVAGLNSLFSTQDSDKEVIIIDIPKDANGDALWADGQTVYFVIGAKDSMTDALNEAIQFGPEIAHPINQPFFTGPPSEVGFTQLDISTKLATNGSWQINLTWNYDQATGQAAAFRLFLKSSGIPNLTAPTSADVLTTLAIDSGDTGPWTYERDGFVPRTYYSLGIAAGRMNPDGTMSWGPITMPAGWENIYFFEIHLFEPHVGPSVPTVEDSGGGSGGGGDSGYVEQPESPATGVTDDGAEDLWDPLTGHIELFRYPDGVLVSDLEPAEGGANVTETHTSADTSAVDGEIASTVRVNAADGKTAFVETTLYRSAGAPTNAPSPTGITTTENSNGTRDIRLDWGAYTQGALQADSLILFWRHDGLAPTVEDAAITFNVNTAAGSYYVFEGINPATVMSFGIAAARRTEVGLEIGAIQAPTASPDWRGVVASTPNYTANVAGGSAATVKDGSDRARVGLNLDGDLVKNLVGGNILEAGTLWIPSFSTIKHGNGADADFNKPIKIPAANFQPLDPSNDAWGINSNGFLHNVFAATIKLFTVFRLPVGVLLKELTVHWTKLGSSDDMTLFLYRINDNGGSATLLLTVNDGGTGWHYSSGVLSETVGSRPYMLLLDLVPNAEIGGNHVAWAELEWAMTDYREAL